MPRGAQQALEAGGARRISNDYSFTSAPQLKRDPLGSQMPALLVLSDARVAEEIRHAEDVVAAEANWYRARRERVCWLMLRAASIYVAGGLLAWSSFALTGDAAQIALWGGLLLNNAGPLVFGYDFWMREQGSW